ncbi:hypothetical protein D7B24_001387 [Verticillium nonalfalfae]|uniref:Uncharacterized protein n=1 Tax=Verticillium nonalfalfae TaxID=1051616 RepID=A0A3M9Y1J6_9PEZI|nr:uncharacterized protein D7B24_001387 [Verticillium nonalfalfae]RNJ53756.1 hypothetical protein D7B24_001387 [Verticillium nonalfalfae]
MSVYCSNYYGSIQCRNFATRFGDRCGFCKVHERGRPIKEGKLPNVPTAWEPCSPTIEEEEDEGYKTTSGSTLHITPVAPSRLVHIMSVLLDEEIENGYGTVTRSQWQKHPTVLLPGL